MFLTQNLLQVLTHARFSHHSAESVGLEPSRKELTRCGSRIVVASSSDVHPRSHGTPGEVRIVVRSVWQGLLDWWNPPTAPSVNATVDPSLGSRGGSLGARSNASVEPDRKVEFDRAAHSQSAERSPLVVSQDSETPKRAHLVDVSRRDPDQMDPTDEELMEFLAADHEPVEADPEFKRKLRDQLWTLVQGNELTRQ